MPGDGPRLPLRNRRIQLPGFFADPVTVEEAVADGELLFLRVRTTHGRLEEVTVDADELAAALEATPAEASPLVPAKGLYLLLESRRIRLAFAYDPYFAVSLSGVEALPHQLEAVYEHMLPQARLRFLLADDPGAGKTIMTGLLLKELFLRGALERVLILSPAPLTIQWQDELRSKFDETFEVITSDLVKNQVAGNVWDRFPKCIASIDFAKQDDVWPLIERVPWDLVVIDEAHKCAARSFGDEIKKTRRYALAERLSARVERMLLLTATPHQGDPDQFGHFLKLLDPDQFVDTQLNKDLLRVAGNPWFMRRMKEELRDFEGRKLFTERHPITQEFTLTPQEKDLYDQVTQYINDYLPRQQGQRRMSVALARTVIQRRLASSLRAIICSMERRHRRLADLLAELVALPQVERARRLRLMLDLPADDEQESDDQEEQLEDAAAAQVTTAQRLDDLRRELEELDRLIRLARETEASGQEAKLSALKTCLDRAEFADLRDGRGKLLIFTEHRDTLEYLKERLHQWGYSTCEIHGGMDAQKRKEAQATFRRDAQVCIATEAAGEGINLQFCHLMINYDIPWNPNRLEQRMGRIHRIGQKLDVYIFNFVAENTVEGRILQRLMKKLDEMRTALGDRVFDVIGMLLRLNEVSLEEILREAAYNPRRLDEYEDQIRRISADRLKEFEAATGIAMAVSHVDLGRIRERDMCSEERRLMPEYVEEFFLEAAAEVRMRVESRADTLWRVEHVPEALRSNTLEAVRHGGAPRSEYRKFTFRKHHLSQPHNLDAELMSPGHPLFAAMGEVLERKLASVGQGSAPFIDPGATAPYRIHFYEIKVLGEAANGQPRLVHERLAAVLEALDGTLEPAPPDVLHDLTPSDEPPATSAPAVEGLQRIERWVKGRVQHPITQEQRAQREREITIRHEYLEKAFGESLKVARRRWSALAARVAGGEEAARLARDEARKRLAELEQRKERKLAELTHLRVVRPGAVVYLGSALVTPSADPALRTLMHRDDEVEHIAMETAMAYERARGWEPVDVSTLRDGSGFDIRSLGPTDAAGRRPVRRIEVKGRAATGDDVVLTPNEWLQARRHRSSYWLYVVWGCGTREPRLVTIQDPATALAGAVEALTEVKGYRVPGSVIGSCR